MRDYIVGIRCNGEHLIFARWLYNSWLHEIVRDEFLLSALNGCVEFREYW